MTRHSPRSLGHLARYAALLLALTLSQTPGPAAAGSAKRTSIQARRAAAGAAPPSPSWA